MKTKATTLIVLSIALTVLSGVLRGMVDQRWGMVDGMADAAARVEALPEEFGDWKAVRVAPIGEDAAKMLRCAGSTVRTYVHKQTGQSVSLIFLVGPAGPLAIHTPDVCYGSNNYTAVESRRQKTIRDVNGNEHPFSVITFAENELGQRLLRVYYAWNSNGDWLAPSTPRTAFAGLPMLYKVQVATQLHWGVGTARIKTPPNAS